MAKSSFPEIPTHCVRCKSELEVGQRFEKFSGALSAWWRFTNGTEVTCNPSLPAPKRCNRCALGYFISPDGRLINGLGGF